MATEITIRGHRYMQVDESSVPGAVAFSAPSSGGGQMVTWEYGAPYQRSEGAPGDLYARRVEPGVATIYYRRASAAEVES